MSRNLSGNMRLLSLQAARALRRRQTPVEERLWSALRNRKLEGWKFLRQYALAVEFEAEERFLIADFFCAAAQLIVEVDGPVHDSKREFDGVRDRLLEEMGYHSCVSATMKLRKTVRAFFSGLRRL